MPVVSSRNRPPFVPATGIVRQTSRRMRLPTPSDLKLLEFFDHLSDDELTALARQARLHDLAEGQLLFLEGSPLEQGLRFVLSGGLRLYKTSVAGKETILRLIHPRELFGVAALFDRQVAPATAAATQATVVLEIYLADMTGFLAEHPDISLKLLVAFAGRLRDTQDTLHAVMSERARTRLARVIVQLLAREGGDVVSGGLRLRTRLPHSTLCRLVGITYEECVRLVREWADEPALLRYGRGGVITLIDPERIQQIAQDV